MENASVYQERNQPFVRKMPIVIKVIGATILIGNALLLAVYAFLALLIIFKASLGAGLLLVLTPLGWLTLASGPFLGFAALSWFESLEHIENSFEYWFKVIGAFIGALVLSNLVYYLGVMFAGFIAGFIGGSPVNL